MITGDCEHTWAKCGSYDRVKLLFRLAQLRAMISGSHGTLHFAYLGIFRNTPFWKGGHVPRGKRKPNNVW